MKKLFSGISALAIFVAASASFALANGSYSEPTWQPVIHNEGLNFQASYQNGVVNMSWNKFTPTSSDWVYWKVVRSTSLTQPVYPDNGYIKYDGNMNFTSYTDSNPPRGTVYYGICAITKSSAGKWRNCDWQAVNVDGSTTTTTDSGNGDGTITQTQTTTTTTAGLSDAMKGAIDTLVEKFKSNLSAKFGSDMAGKKAFLAALVPVINNVVNTASSTNKPMFEYLKTKIVEYQAIVELEDILSVE